MDGHQETFALASQICLHIRYYHVITLPLSSVKYTRETDPEYVAKGKTAEYCADSWQVLLLIVCSIVHSEFST